MKRVLILTVVWLFAGCDGEPARCADPDGTGTREAPRATLGEPVVGVACAEASDWLAVPAGATAVQISAEADVVAELFRGAEVLRSERGRALRWPLDEPADRVSVRAAAGSVGYTVEVELSTACPEAQVHDVDTDGPTLRLCAGQPAQVALPGDVATRSTMRVVGTAPFTAEVQIGPWQERWASASDQVSFSNNLARAGRATLRSDVDQRVTIELVTGPAPTTRARATARVVGTSRAVTVDGLGPEAEAPVGGALVSVTSPDGLVVAAESTSEAGVAALDFAAALEPGGPAWAVSAWAIVQSGGDRVSVARRRGQPWSATLGEVEAPGDAGEVALDDPSVATALHVARVTADGLERFREARPGLPPLAVEIVWAPEQASACGTCYRPETGHIELSGRASDPDQWDHAVLWHELSHVVTDTACEDDSPGGAHGDPPTAPTVAWSEGVATYLASWISGDPLQLDYRVVGVRAVDISALPAELAGTTDGTAEGDLSERLVAALLWRLDGALGDAVVLDALFGQLPERADVGPRGADLVDFLDAVTCLTDAPIQPHLDAVSFPYTPRCR